MLDNSSFIPSRNRSASYQHPRTLDLIKPSVKKNDLLPRVVHLAIQPTGAKTLFDEDTTIVYSNENMVDQLT